MTSSTKPAAQACVLGPGEGQTIWFLRNRMTIKATAGSTGGAYGLVESLIAPGFSPPLHVHRREDETFWILEGNLTLRCGDQTFRADAGSYVFLPRDVPHTFVVDDGAPARLLTLLTPGGGEGLFVQAGRPAAGDGLPPIEPLDLNSLRSAGEAYGTEIVGPPMATTSVTEP